jgi:hypothetical protein
MLVELLHPAGPDLVRRLAAALMLVPRDEREAVVSAIERRVVETYGAIVNAPAATLTHVAPPIQKPGYVEQVETDYERPPHVVQVDVASSKPRAKSTALASKPPQRRAK